MGYGAGDIPSLLYSEEFVAHPLEECFLPAGITLQPTLVSPCQAQDVFAAHSFQKAVAPAQKPGKFKAENPPLQSEGDQRGKQGVLVDADDDPWTPMLPATGSASAASPTNVE